MYNSTNLPLSKKKIIKKTLEKTPIFFVIALVCGILIVFAFLLSDMLSKTALTWVVLLAILVIILTIIGVYIYQVYYYKLYFYDFREDGAEIAKGVISRSTGHVRYERIQNIFVDQDILDRIFGLYDVHYETAGETSGIYSHVDGLDKNNSEKLVEFLNSQLTKTGDQKNIPNKVAGGETLNSEIKITGEIIDRGNTPIQGRVVIKNSLIMLFSYLIFLLILASKAYDLFIEFGISQSLALMIFFIVSIIFVIGIIVYNKIWYKNFYFQFTNASGVIKSQVIAQTNSYVYYDRIQNITVTQGIIERFFGLFSVFVETAGEANKKGGASGLRLSGLSKGDAEKIKNFLLDKVKVFKNRI